MSEHPLVSVVIPTYNYAGYLPHAIESVLGQTYPEIEIIVVDDGSTDGTEQVLQQYEGKIRCFRQENRGVAIARNRGISESRGQYVAFLDPDDVWLPEKIEKQIALFRSDNRIGLVHCGVEDINGRGERIAVHMEGMEGWVASEMLLFRRPVILGGGSGAMVWRRAIEAVGGFDPRLATSADWDFYYRIASRFRIGFVREVLLRYRIHGANMHMNVRRMEKEMRYAFEKAFGNAEDRSVSRLRRLAYGRLHLVLAGSYFRAGDYPRCAVHALRSVCKTPSCLRHLLGYPARCLRRRRMMQ